MSKLYWLIEVVFPLGGEVRSARYFDGSTERGWHGNTTTDPNHAVKYLTRTEADIDLVKLAPRLIGDWVVREHKWV